MPMSEKNIQQDEETKIRHGEEFLNLYEDIHAQLADFKHLVYSTTQLGDLDSLAALFSKKMWEHSDGRENAVWLLTDESRVEERARNGEQLTPGEGRSLDADASESVGRVLNVQLVTWPSDTAEGKMLFPELEMPVLFPIKGRPRPLGFMVVDCAGVEGLEFYQFTAQFMSLILNMACLHRQVKVQRDELSAMSELLLAQNTLMASLQHSCTNVVSVTDPVRLSQTVADSAVTELGAQRAAVFLLDGGTNELVGIAHSGGFDDVEQLRIPFREECPLHLCIRSGRIIGCEDHPQELHLGSHRLSQWRLFPLKARGRIRGLLIVEKGDSDISDPIAILTNHAGMVLDNLLLMEEQRRTAEELAAKSEALARANEMLDHLSTTDHLTSLCNRRSFMTHLDNEFERAKRYSLPLALMVIDVDRFKTVNDRYGHAVGDMVLQEVATRIRQNLRQMDIVARYGGDEITIILPGTERHQAGFVAEKLSSIISGKPVFVNGQSLLVSISTGVTAYPACGAHSQEDLFKQADQAMYQAKKKGRGQVVVAPPSP